jgi:hypothetical protein
VLFASEYAIHFLVPAIGRSRYLRLRVRDLNLLNQTANCLAFVSQQSEFSWALLMGRASSAAPL